MAHPLHLALLSEGTETWNSWRHRHPEVVADFREAHLAHLNFDHAHLIGATFVKANLSQATLQGADLSVGDLSDACLMGADLRGADLREAFFQEDTLPKPSFGGVICKQSTLVTSTCVPPFLCEISVVQSCQAFLAALP